MISKFHDEHAFLSNFYSSPINYIDRWYPTVEHAYQAYKCRDDDSHELIRTANTPGIAKRLGRKVEIQDNWDQIKTGVMLDLLRLKFYNFYLEDLLLKTGDEELVEGNNWHDQFWGVCECPKCKNQGLNTLGKLLMQVRDERRQWFSGLDSSFKFR